MKKLFLLLVCTSILIPNIVKAEGGWSEWIQAGQAFACNDNGFVNGFQITSNGSYYRIVCSPSTNQLNSFFLPKEVLLNSRCESSDCLIRESQKEINKLKDEKAVLQKDLNEAIERIEAIEVELRLIPKNKQKK